jgi:hypothetical protein
MVHPIAPVSRLIWMGVNSCFLSWLAKMSVIFKLVSSFHLENSCFSPKASPPCLSCLPPSTVASAFLSSY